MYQRRITDVTLVTGIIIRFLIFNNIEHMKITICGSIAFFNEMEEIKKNLEQIGHEVKIPPLEIKNESNNPIPIMDYYKIRKNAADNEIWVWNMKEEAMKRHFDKVVWSDAILVLNYKKNDINDYIGPNTFLEMGLALHFSKKIYLLNSIPELSNKEEILGMKPIILNGDLNKIS